MTKPLAAPLSPENNEELDGNLLRAKSFLDDIYGPEVAAPLPESHTHEFHCEHDEQQCDRACRNDHRCRICHKTLAEVSPLPEIASEPDEVKAIALIREYRRSAGDHDNCIDYSSLPNADSQDVDMRCNQCQKADTLFASMLEIIPSPVPLGEPLFRVQTPSDARVEEIKQEIIREFEPALATKTLGEPAQTEETVDELIATLKPHTAYVEMQIRLGLGRIQITDIEDKIASENWGKQNKAYLDLRSQRCRELRLIRVAYELLLERNAALATKAVPMSVLRSVEG